jgi:hypothetical protein
MDKENDPLQEALTGLVESEEGHAYAYGGGSLLAIIIIILLLIWLL